MLMTIVLCFAAPQRARSSRSSLKSLTTTFRSDMRILANFMLRDTWSVHCVAQDCKTLVSEWVTVKTDETLLRLLKASGATEQNLIEIQRDMKRWGKGSTFIEVNDV